MLVDDRLQFTIDLIALRQQFIQFRLPKHIAQCRLSDLRRCLVKAHYVHNGSGRVHHIEVDHRGDFNRHIISCDHLLWGYRERHDTQVNFGHACDKGWHQEYAWSFRPYQTTQDEDDAALILLHDANSREE